MWGPTRRKHRGGSLINLEEHGGFDPLSPYGPYLGSVEVDAYACGGSTTNLSPTLILDG